MRPFQPTICSQTLRDPSRSSSLPLRNQVVKLPLEFLSRSFPFPPPSKHTLKTHPQLFHIPPQHIPLRVLCHHISKFALRDLRNSRPISRSPLLRTQVFELLFRISNCLRIGSHAERWVATNFLSTITRASFPSSPPPLQCLASSSIQFRSSLHPALQTSTIFLRVAKRDSIAYSFPVSRGFRPNVTLFAYSFPASRGFRPVMMMRRRRRWW